MQYFNRQKFKEGGATQAPTDEQLEAIIHSTGLNNYSVDIHDVLKVYPLVALTRMATEATNYLLS